MFGLIYIYTSSKITENRERSIGGANLEKLIKIEEAY